MLEQSQIDDFQKNGAVLLKGVFADFVETAREAIEENMQNPSWRERTYRPDDGGRRFFRIMLYGISLMGIAVWCGTLQCPNWLQN